MGYAENLGSYWRGRYKASPGKYATVRDANGEAIRFRTKPAAKKAADAEEAKLLAGLKKMAITDRTTFGEYANEWYALQDLAPSTMQNYRRHIEEHLLPEFEQIAIVDLTRAQIEEWAKKERQRGYAVSSIKTWRSTLHLILGDAVEDGVREANPASRRRGRGRRAGRSRNRGPEKVVTDALGLLLIAERASLLSGRDDEFVGVTTKGYMGMRWGELVGLETEYVRPKTVRVEHQLYELDTGELHRCPPKDDSYRTLDSPRFITDLLTGHIGRTSPTPCDCHGLTYMFSGHGAANGAAQRPGAKLVDVARRAAVSTGTVSNVLNRPHAVAEATRIRVQQAIVDLGYVRNAASGERARHWRRSGFGTWLFQPAVTGRYPKRGKEEAHPVPVLAAPWPGVRSGGAARRRARTPAGCRSPRA